MEMIRQFAIPGVGLLLTLAFGLWLSSAGKPYNGWLFNIHKLIALGVVVLAGWQFAQILRSASPPQLIIVLLAVAALAVIALFVSGALMSAGQLDYGVMLAIHRIGAPLLLVVLVMAVYWLGWRS